MNNELEQYDITEAQMDVLMYLIQHRDQKVTQKVLTEAFNIKHSTMSGIMQRMQEKGFIEIYVDEENRRSKIVNLTDKAINLKSKLDEHRCETERVLLHSFSDDDISNLYNYLDRIRQNLICTMDLSDEEKERIERRRKC